MKAMKPPAEKTTPTKEKVLVGIAIYVLVTSVQ
jgi:hypothetical protein